MQPPVTAAPVGINWDAFRTQGANATRHLLSSRGIVNEDLRSRYAGRLPLDDPRIIEALGGAGALGTPAMEGIISAYLASQRQNGQPLAVDTTYDSPDTLVAGDDAALAGLNEQILGFLQSEEGRGLVQRARALGLEPGASTQNPDEWVQRLQGMTPERAAELLANNDTRQGLLGRFNALTQDRPAAEFDPTNIAARMERGQFSLTPQWDGVGATGFLANLDSIGRTDPAELERLVGIAERAQGGDPAAQDEWLAWTGATTGRMDPTLTLDEVRQYGSRQQVTDFQRRQREEAGMPTAQGASLFDQTRDAWWQRMGSPTLRGPQDNGMGRTQTPPPSWISGTTEYDAEGNVTYNAQRSDPFGAFQTWGMPRAEARQRWQEVQPSLRAAGQGAMRAVAGAAGQQALRDYAARPVATPGFVYTGPSGTAANVAAGGTPFVWSQNARTR
jgi:hypothetical protein